MAGGKNCMIADNSRVIRRVSQTIMASLGFTCTQAENGQLAIDSCQKELPDLILFEWNMPVLDGIGFIKQLRMMPGGNKPVAVFCTTENSFSRIQEGIAAGANEYIMKPFDGDIIKSKLEMLGLINA